MGEMGRPSAVVAAGVVVAAAAVIAAGVLLPVMVVTGGRLSELKGALQQLGDTRIGVAGASGVQLDAGLGQGHLGTASDAAADEAVHAVGCQEARQSAVAAAVGVHHLGGDHGAVFHVVEFELGRVAEVLEDLSVFIGNCDFHADASFLIEA